MAQTSLIIGDTNWAVKEDSLLGYNVIQNKYLPIPIDTVRATTATRVNEQGLIEIVPRNLVEYSEQFDNAYWTKDGSTISANATTAPNGNLTADKLNETATTGVHRVGRATFPAGTQRTFSVFAKKSERNFVSLFENNSVGNTVKGVIFNLNTGVVSLNNDAAYYFNPTIQDFGNGWYRCSVNWTPISLSVPSVGSSLDGLTNSYVGVSENGIFIYGAQLEEFATATEYFPTTNRLDIPRIDYSTGSAALLVEPQRTNVLLRSEEFDNASWAKSSVGSGLNPVVTANFAISPDGTQDADRIVFNTPLSTDISQITQAISLTGSSTGSVYLKAEASGDVGKVIAIRFNSAGYTLVTLTNNWQRFSVTATALSSFDIALRPAIGTSTGSVSVLAWGAQLEVGSYATSYIPTIASSVTRNADVLGRTGISSLIGQTEGTLFLDFIAEQTPTLSQSHIWIGNGANEIGVYGGSQLIFYSSGGVSINAGNYTTGQRYKIAFAYKLNDYVAYVNGVLKGTDTSATVPTTSNLSINSYFDGSEIQKKQINSVQLYKTRLTNDELQLLTTI